MRNDFGRIVLAYFFIMFISVCSKPPQTTDPIVPIDENNSTIILHVKSNVLSKRPANIEKALYEQANDKENNLKERFVYLNQKFRNTHRAKTQKMKITQKLDVLRNFYPQVANEATANTTAATVSRSSLKPESQTDLDENNIIPGAISRELEYIELLKPPLVRMPPKYPKVLQTPSGGLPSKNNKVHGWKNRRPSKFIFKPQEIFNDKSAYGNNHADAFQTFGDFLNDINYDFFKSPDNQGGELFMDQYLRDAMDEQESAHSVDRDKECSKLSRLRSVRAHLSSYWRLLLREMKCKHCSTPTDVQIANRDFKDIQTNRMSKENLQLG